MLAVTALMAALAVTAGQSAPRCALTVAAVLTGQLSVGWCNDAFDAPRDIAARQRGKPLVDGAVGVRTVWTAAFLALALCVPLSFGCGPRAGAVHLTGVAWAWAYDLKLKATAWSWLPYAIGFAGLPAFVALGLPGQPWPAWWIVVAGALLGIGAHLGDVLPDIRSDLELGVRGWPHRLGPDGARLLLPVPLVAASAVLVLGPAGPPDKLGAGGSRSGCRCRGGRDGRGAPPGAGGVRRGGHRRGGGCGAAAVERRHHRLNGPPYDASRRSRPGSAESGAVTGHGSP